MRGVEEVQAAAGQACGFPRLCIGIGGLDGDDVEVSGGFASGAMETVCAQPSGLAAGRSRAGRRWPRILPRRASFLAPIQTSTIAIGHDVLDSFTQIGAGHA
jgi:hypothetical protein